MSEYLEISEIVRQITRGDISLPVFQRGFVWKRDQVRDLFDSLYKGYPVGGLLMWTSTNEKSITKTEKNGNGNQVRLILDGQQRITTLYSIFTGNVPEFFEGNIDIFKYLYFNLENENFTFYQRSFDDNPLWINVSEFLQSNERGTGIFAQKYANHEKIQDKLPEYIAKLANLSAIKNFSFHIDDVGSEKNLETVVKIFNRVNERGTKLTQGDIAFANICTKWTEARQILKNELKLYENAGYNFDMNWLLRSMNATITGEAKFSHLQDKKLREIRSGFNKARTHIEYIINNIKVYLGLDNSKVFFGRNSVPVMVRYLEIKNRELNSKELGQLLYWYIQVVINSRYSGSTEFYIDKDFEILEKSKGDVEALINQLKLEYSSLNVKPDDFGWSKRATCYPILYMLGRMGGARDWGTGMEIVPQLIGRANQIEVHHIFPKSLLKEFERDQVNSLANYCFLYQDTNLNIGNQLPEEYLPKILEKFPNALESQWIPSNPKLWKIENYLRFLKERKRLLARAANRQLKLLLDGDFELINSKGSNIEYNISMKIETDDRDSEISELNNWITSQNFSKGEVLYEYVGDNLNEVLAIFDIAWPSGLQEGLSDPIAVVLDEEDKVAKIANEGGFLCFTSIESFKKYVEKKYPRK